MNKNWRLILRARSTGLLFPMIVFFGFVAGGLVIWQNWLLSGVIGRVFLDNYPLAQVVPLLRLILLIVIGRVLFTLFNEYFSGRLAVRIKSSLRGELLHKLNRLGPVYLRGERAGELATTALQGLDALDAYFGQYLPQILLAALLPLSILITVFPIDPLTGVVFFLTAPLIPLFMILIGKLSANHTKKQWQALSRLGAYFLDTLQGLTTLITLGRSRERGDEIARVSDQYRQVTMNVFKITFLSAFVLEMIATISTALVAVEIGLRLLYARMEFQQAFFILLMAPEFYLPLRNLSLRYHAGMNGLTAAKRVFEILDIPEEETQPHITTTLKNPFEESFTLTFEDVSYHYPQIERLVLQNINCSLVAGKQYALVGQSGAGKSTLTALLLRFISPTSGKILINGEPIDQWSAADWRKWIAWVPQNARLFNTSLLENVRLHNSEISRQQVEEVLARVSLDKLLSRLQHGLDTPLLEGGVRLSGGEARRVVLARAFLKNAPLLVMDEPTAHLDLELEQEVLQATQDLQSGRTSIKIAHRLATVRTADTIFVLKEGQLIEEGTHAQLLQMGQEYSRLLKASGGTP